MNNTQFSPNLDDEKDDIDSVHTNSQQLEQSLTTQPNAQHLGATIEYSGYSDYSNISNFNQFSEEQDKKMGHIQKPYFDSEFFDFDFEKYELPSIQTSLNANISNNIPRSSLGSVGSFASFQTQQTLPSVATDNSSNAAKIAKLGLNMAEQSQSDNDSISSLTVPRYLYFQSKCILSAF